MTWISRYLSDCGIEILWFDSLGAKSSSLRLRGRGCDVVVDPGAAAMQPSYPLPRDEKVRLKRRAQTRLRDALASPRVKAVIITHYHHDHYPWPGSEGLPPQLLKGKLVIAKNPNTYINMSQWRRAREFFEDLARSAGLRPNEIYETPPSNLTHPLPDEALSIAMSRDFGDYSRRRKELLARGRAWFMKVSGAWAKGRWVREFEGRDGTRVVWADARFLDVCGVRLVFTEPWFHGAEYDRTGWVVGFLAEVSGCRVVYSSDVMGPIIEDYAERIAGWGPDVVVLDGPPTYLYPYLLSGVNLRRAIENAKTVIESEPAMVIYDHHLLRERRWRERVREVLEHARTKGVPLLTAADALGRRPVIDELT